MSTRRLTLSSTYRADSAWHEIGAGGEPAFQNSWVNYGSTFDTAAFRMDPDGWVHFKGLIKSGSGVVFTLPAGYRPARTSYGTNVNNGSPGYVSIGSNGNVSIGISSGSNAYCSLNGVSFPVWTQAECNERYSILSGFAQRTTTDEWFIGAWKKGNGFVRVQGIQANTAAVSKMWLPMNFVTDHVFAATDNSANAKRFDVCAVDAGSLNSATTTWTIINAEYGTVEIEDLWINATLQNSWAAYPQDAFRKFTTAQYMRDDYGYVHLRGFIRNGSSATATMFTLPNGGYRPAADLVFPAMSAAGSGVCRIDITSSGAVSAAAGGSTTWTSLSGISFYPG